jgi:hypothetical protein
MKELEDKGYEGWSYIGSYRDTLNFVKLNNGNVVSIAFRVNHAHLQIIRDINEYGGDGWSFDHMSYKEVRGRSGMYGGIFLILRTSSDIKY